MIVPNKRSNLKKPYVENSDSHQRPARISFKIEDCNNPQKTVVAELLEQ